MTEYEASNRTDRVAEPEGDKGRQHSGGRAPFGKSWVAIVVANSPYRPQSHHSQSFRSRQPGELFALRHHCRCSSDTPQTARPLETTQRPRVGGVCYIVRPERIGRKLSTTRRDPQIHGAPKDAKNLPNALPGLGAKPHLYSPAPRRQPPPQPAPKVGLSSTSLDDGRAFRKRVLETPWALNTLLVSGQTKV